MVRVHSPVVTGAFEPGQPDVEVAGEGEG